MKLVQNISPKQILHTLLATNKIICTIIQQKIHVPVIFSDVKNEMVTNQFIKSFQTPKEIPNSTQCSKTMYYMYNWGLCACATIQEALTTCQTPAFICR